MKSDDYHRQEQYDFARFGITCFAVGFFLGVLIYIALFDYSANKLALERSRCMEGRVSEARR